ncbi:unnamed protein product [Caenorhabditis angaria]|uniref:Peroxiredoxin-like 2A n=1 Tax=Caenorhabditis angaria TaxID=860376 RepID=A0A9P1MUT9_9PELO|nr:unnamed protein product [Caenorhabditis angaria]
MEYFGWTSLAALSSAVIYANLPTRLTIGAVVPTFAHLAKAQLVPISGEPNDPEVIDESKSLEASKLFDKGAHLVMAVRRPGCLLCRREAAEINNLAPALKAANINLIAVVHETLGANKFKNYFTNGQLFLDTQRTFYGPNERWLPIWMGFLRIGTYINVRKAKEANVNGNLKGEGRLLGGVFLVADGELKYAHLEKEWGDAADIEEVKAAIEKYAKSR